MNFKNELDNETFTLIARKRIAKKDNLVYSRELLYNYLEFSLLEDSKTSTICKEKMKSFQWMKTCTLKYLVLTNSQTNLTSL